MDQNAAQKPAQPRLNLYTRALRRERIFSRLRLGESYAVIAAEEGVSEQRVRKIVSDALKRQETDDLPDHALLQLLRLEGALARAAEAVAGGDVKAIGPYLQVLDHIDRYRKAGARQEVYDAAGRERLFAKMNRTIARLEAETRKSATEAPAEPRPAPDGQSQPVSDASP